MVIQLAQAYQLARQQDVRSIFFWENSWISSGVVDLPHGVKLERATIARRKEGPPPQLVVRSRMFNEAKMPNFTSRTESEEFRLAVRAGLSIPEPGRQKNGRNTLTIHLRSGDIYGPRPHPEYGQPPLSFYTSILDTFSYSTVVIVTEDRLSPVLDPLLAHCHKRGLSTEMRGSSLTEAIATIGGATAVVGSRGTFVPSICWLYPKNRVLFSFAETPSAFELAKTKHFLVSDTVGAFVRSSYESNWANTETQRNLMVNYPSGSLSPPGEVN